MLSFSSSALLSICLSFPLFVSLTVSAFPFSSIWKSELKSKTSFQLHCLFSLTLKSNMVTDALSRFDYISIN